MRADEQRGQAEAAQTGSGIRASATRVVSHLRTVARLDKELARAEMQRKGGLLGAGTALVVGIGVLALYAIGVALALLTALLALVVDWWLALLIVLLVLVLAMVALGVTARALFRAATPFKPEQALEEARLTREAVRGKHAD